MTYREGRPTVVTELILKPRILTVEDLPFLADLGRVKNGILFLDTYFFALVLYHKST